MSRSGRIVHLSPKEYDVLTRLAEAGGKVITHTELLMAIWGPSHNEDIQYLRTFISQIRQKIENRPAQPKLVITEPGVGYRFVSSL